MKKKITFISMTIFVGGLLYFTNIHTGKAYYYGPPAGYTGSPADGQTCVSCHSSFALQSPQPWISSDVPVAGYIPGTIYNMTAKAVSIGKSSFGFEISPQNASGTGLGTLILTNSTTTQLASAIYIEQTASGYQGTDSVVWTFQWKAPAAGTGSVTFYGAFNCGTGTDESSAHIYPATLLIKENSALGIDNIAAENASLLVFPNPATTQLTIKYNLNQSGAMEVNMFSMGGEKVATLMPSSIQNNGEHQFTAGLPGGIKAGMYFIQLINDGKSSVQKIIVE